MAGPGIPALSRSVLSNSSRARLNPLYCFQAIGFGLVDYCSLAALPAAISKSFATEVIISA